MPTENTLDGVTLPDSEKSTAKLSKGKTKVYAADDSASKGSKKDRC